MTDKPISVGVIQYRILKRAGPDGWSNMSDFPHSVLQDMKDRGLIEWHPDHPHQNFVRNVP